MPLRWSACCRIERLKTITGSLRFVYKPPSPHSPLILLTDRAGSTEDLHQHIAISRQKPEVTCSTNILVPGRGLRGYNRFPTNSCRRRAPTKGAPLALLLLFFPFRLLNAHTRPTLILYAFCFSRVSKKSKIVSFRLFFRRYDAATNDHYNGWYPALRIKGGRAGGLLVYNLVANTSVVDCLKAKLRQWDLFLCKTFEELVADSA